MKGGVTVLKVHQKPQGWVKWVVAGVLLLYVLMAWATDDMTPSWFLPLMGLLLLQRARGQRLILSPHVLLVQEAAQVHRVPLAVAEVQELKRGWHVRWQAGRITRKVTATAPAPFREAVERAADEARQAEPGLMPVTEKEAARATLFAQEETAWAWVAMALLVVAVPMGLANWLQQPLVLLILPILAAVSDRLYMVREFVVAADQFWVLDAKGGAHPIPLANVRLKKVHTYQVVLATDDPAFPLLRVALRGTEPDFVTHLESRLAGEPLRFERPNMGTEPDHPEGALRCSLCGRPEPDGVAGSGLFICERCAGRTRHEAHDAGHGLGSKEPKPM